MPAPVPAPHLSLGVSPRGQLAWRNAARAAALAEGRDFVLPDDLKALALPTLAHRLVIAGEGGKRNKTVSEVHRLLCKLAAPAVNDSGWRAVRAR